MKDRPVRLIKIVVVYHCQIQEKQAAGTLFLDGRRTINAKCATGGLFDLNGAQNAPKGKRNDNHNTSLKQLMPKQLYSDHALSSESNSITSTIQWRAICN